MIFPYWQEVRDGETRWLPLVRPTLAGPSGVSIAVWALADSGAEHNVFSLEVAQALRVDPRDGASVTLVGIGGTEVHGALLPVAFQLGRYRWTAPVIFSRAVAERGVLGQAGFFAFFTVTFRYRKREVEVRRTLRG